MRYLPLFLLLLFVEVNSSFAQQSFLDYSGYHLSFQDDFRYPDPDGKYPSKAYTLYKSFTSNWRIAPIDHCTGWGREMYNDSQVSMPRYGIIRLTEDTGSFPVCTQQYRGKAPWPVRHVSGMVGSKFYITLGIIEASIKLPPGRCDSTGCDDAGIVDTAAWPAFWIYPNGVSTVDNEIDIIDLDNPDDWKVTSRIFLSKKGEQQQYYETNARLPWIRKLSAGFHKYSCLWTLTGASFYLDEEFLGSITYKDGQTYDVPHQFLFSLQTHKATKSGLTMDIDWVKVWVKD